jgi:tripartite-type tricarboxylate transporter receptor subunit TctC
LPACAKTSITILRTKRRTFLAGAAAPALARTQWRLAGQVLHEKLGATVVVENRAGGSASIGTTAMLNAPPDGYTLLASTFHHIILNHAVKGATFDPQADFETSGRTARAPLLMVLAPNRPEKTIAEVIAAAKAVPNDWTFAIPALGPPSHLATVDFMSRAALTIAISPYRGTAPALTDVIGGHVQLLIDASFALLPAAEEGRVKALGITTGIALRLRPTFRSWRSKASQAMTSSPGMGCGPPKGTPRAICDRVNALMRETMRDPPVVEPLNKSLLEPVIETSEESKAFFAAGVPKHVALLKKASFEAQ